MGSEEGKSRNWIRGEKRENISMNISRVSLCSFVPANAQTPIFPSRKRGEEQNKKKA